MKIDFLSSSFSKTIISTLFISSLIVTSGCQSIPPGIPPEGPIVSINTTDEIPLAPKNAINDMTTAIATSSVLYEYGDTPVVNLKGDKIPEELKAVSKRLAYLTSHLFRNLVEMDMVKLPITFNNTEVNFIINSTFSPNYDREIDNQDNNVEIINWKLELLSPEKPVTLWKQNLKVKIRKDIKKE